MLSRMPGPDALPPLLSAHIRRTVRYAKLTRPERASATALLSAACQRRLDGGETPDGILDSSPGPRAEAANLAAEFRRRRSRLLRLRLAFNRQIKRGLLVALVGYAFLAFLFYSRSPSITRNYAAEFNTKASATPESDRAWPLYQRSASRFEEQDKDPFWDRWPDMRPGEPAWEEVGARLEHNREALQYLREAARKPALGFMIYDLADKPADPYAVITTPAAASNPPYLDWTLDYLGRLRNGARWLKLDAVHAAATGERARTLEDLLSLFRMAGHAREHPIVIADLTSVAIFALACGVTGEIVADYGGVLSDEDLGRIAEQVGAFPGGPMVRFDGERLFFEDFLQRVYSDDGHGSGHMTAEGLRNIKRMQGDPNPRLSASELLFSPFSVSIASRKDLHEAFDRLVKAVEADQGVPPWTRHGLLTDAEIDRLNDPSMARGHTIVAVLGPAFTGAVRSSDDAGQMRGATLVAVALGRFHLATGAYPRRLDELVPEFLEAVPPDVFDGLPIKYVVAEGGPVLYSIGADRDDDGGVKPAPGSPNQHSVRNTLTRAPPDGDWVLWPVRPEPPKAEPETPDGEE
jgi:hypothetical protein